MAPRRRLKIACIEAGKSQRQIADEIADEIGGFDERRFSDIVLGRRRPSEAERAAIAAAVGQPVDALFDSTDTQDAAPRLETPSSPGAA
jgi:transcriptional regulator with XRE-family HTH domain